MASACASWSDDAGHVRRTRGPAREPRSGPAMALTREFLIDGRRVYVFDDEVAAPVVNGWYEDLSLQRGYTRSEYANVERVHIRHWATEFEVSEFAASPLGLRTVELVSRCFPDEGQRPYRAYCNVAAYGDMLSLHRDCPPAHDDVTALWFICDEWQRDWRGELLLF